MKGLLKAKPAGTQFLILLGIAVASLFIISLAGVMLISGITGISIETLSDSAKWSSADDRIVNVIRGMQVVQFVALFLIPSVICARLFSSKPADYLGFKAPSNAAYYLVGTAALILAIPFVNLLGHLNQQVQFPPGIESWMKQQEEEAGRTMKIILSKHTITDLILNIICIAGLAAVGEELLFRSMVQRIIIKWFKSPMAGIIIAAFLFSAMHVQFYGFLPRFVLGILLGMLYWYSGSIWVAILGHFIYDAFLVVLVYLNPESMNDDNALNISNLALIAAISFVLVAGLVWWMKKKSTTTFNEVYAEDLAAKNHPFDFEGKTPE